jgi:hypothetical protein
MGTRSFWAIIALLLGGAEGGQLKLAVFDVDVTPPLGSMMAYDPVKRVDELTLRARGIVLIGSGDPVVLCAVDWIGIANESNDALREALAAAVGSARQRVAVHTLHQHDAPCSDFSAERLLKEAGKTDLARYEGAFQRQCFARIGQAAKAAMSAAQPVTECGWGEAAVKEVASNRRIKGADGRVRATRYTATVDAKLRAEPEGVIDPMVSVLSFWNGKSALAVLSYYACHPQSYYRTGIPSPDIPGIARFIRGQAEPTALHVHFNGAGGNIGAGKYNDGSHENRVALATRLAEGMKRAFESSVKFPVQAGMVTWATEPVALPLGSHVVEADLRQELESPDPKKYLRAVDHLAFAVHQGGGHKIDLGCLAIGEVRVLHMPGELFVEYQLAAKRLRGDLRVMMAAYGDYGPGYIGTAAEYPLGGYETSPGASAVAPEVEAVLMEGMRKLLQVSR